MYDFSVNVWNFLVYVSMFQNIFPYKVNGGWPLFLHFKGIVQ